MTIRPKVSLAQDAIRLADKNDYDIVLRLCKLFHKESPYSDVPFSEEKINRIFLQYLNSNKTEIIILLLGESDGILVGTCVEFLFSKEKLASELIWYVEKEKRKFSNSLKLLKAFDFWAKKVGASYISTASVDKTVKLDPLYKRHGYKEYEKTYMKEL